MARGGDGTARDASGRWRSPAGLVLLVAGVELLVYGLWAVLKGAKVSQDPYDLRLCAGGGVLLAVLVWWLVYRRPRGAARPSRAVGDRAARVALQRLDRMDPARLAEHVAELCRRDAASEVATSRVQDDAYSVDVTASSATGTRLVVRCRSVSGASTVTGDAVERFAEAEEHADRVRILATTGGTFSPRARDRAADAVTLLDRRALARWDLAEEIPDALAAEAVDSAAR
ncbi:restriction endonuclease [Yinghuangia seranimata]|uniref:restriction endonuclease n=1 Tax=Yinghuangia seranimata TaxID=408067 RepID=UPI00248D37F8|nr:restriction endonuclease [Yinghuangia seranimata]MDI2128528.1 restriction endonuclease [Yinghuangia seranimata]